MSQPPLEIRSRRFALHLTCLSMWNRPKMRMGGTKTVLTILDLLHMNSASSRGNFSVRWSTKPTMSCADCPSGICHTVATTPSAPAGWNACRNLVTPSPPFPSPRPVSHAERTCVSCRPAVASSSRPVRTCPTGHARSTTLRNRSGTGSDTGTRPHCCGGAASRMVALWSSLNTRIEKRWTGWRSGVLTRA